MDLVFIYDDKIAQDTDGNYYTGAAFSQAVFDRYLQHFDHITLLMRKAKIAPDDTDTLSRMNRLNTDNIDVIFLPTFTENVKDFLSVGKRCQFKKIIEDNIAEDRAVIIRSHSDSARIAAKYCHKIGKTFLVEVVGCPWDSLWNLNIKGKILAPLAWLQLRKKMKYAPYSVYVTDKFLQQRYPTRGILAAISDVELQPMDEAILEKRLEKIENHSGKIKIATAGALHVPYKGQKYVIEALARLKEQGNTNFIYHLAGGGDNSYLKKFAEQMGVSDCVVFEGVLPHDRMFGWLDDMDVYIQPSTVEAMPRALIEAMSRGLPCFASNVGAMPELVGEQNVFRKKDVTAIAEYLNSFSKEQAIHLANNNFDQAKAFQKELLEKKRFDFYAEFVQKAEEQ